MAADLALAVVLAWAWDLANLGLALAFDTYGAETCYDSPSVHVQSTNAVVMAVVSWTKEGP